MRFRNLPQRNRTIAMPHCPVCQREFQPDDGPAMPFCSERCRMIDLGRWLDEKFGIPVEPEEGEVREPQPDADRRG